MLFYTGLFLLVIAVSMDGLGVGISYGMKKTRVPLHAILIIMLSSGLTVLAAMTIGDFMEAFLSPTIPEKIGGIILIFLGLFTFINLLRGNKNKKNTKRETSNALSDMKKVIVSPVKADLDCSGIISAGEAVLLGIALALDAFGAGIAASFLHYSPLLTAGLVAIMSGGFLFIGTRLGIILSRYEKSKHLSYLPSFLLISIGVINLI